MPNESVCATVLQILVPFLLAGLGTVMAGMLLDVVQHWDVFQTVTEIFILVPALLGLKGNLEMTLASRLSTAMNTGRMNSPREKWNLIIGNLALKQVQATVLGFLAALAASALGWVLDEKLVMNYAALLCCSSVVTAFTASLLQGIIMVGVIIVSKRAGINPDNIATPMAASFGDLITLGLLAVISQGFLHCVEPSPCVVYVVCVLFLCLTPVWVIISFCHPESRRLLYCSWEPIITAMVISSLGGLILDRAMTDPNLMGVVLYTPVINGVGGNLVAIQSSHIATYLHFYCSLGELPEHAKGCYCPSHTFYGKGPTSRTAQVLLLLAIPGHLIFLYIIYLMQGGHTSPTATFITLYLVAAFTQVFLLLCIADWMVHCLWRYGRDPDSFAIPYLTALGDLLGTALLALCFYLLPVITDEDNHLGD
ncbi:LOW QUALITY PROTEIN: solute carrier family 41 member 2 [Colossoma macropomum]|uniref:LOW QUALITY PROTEIN: solute carrier family 41 member 2 n=1 Tax=Colossoma macropomum TaxID=42526 RepID=UPI0018649119|nr:LOW QUALITY PROTEIN: solute carrier family 41 member 2 [Colossoma macropomum]